MFTGNIEVHCEDTAFRIDATYWKDLEVDYSKIEFLEYRQDFDVGVRTSGFGSARLKMGTFQNDEFIGMKDADKAREIYQSISAKMGPLITAKIGPAGFLILGHGK